MIEEQAKPKDDNWEWAIVEIFGHIRHAGRAREEERFGAKMLRIDVPVNGDPAGRWTTTYYGAASIFSYRITDEETVKSLNKPYERPGLARLSARSETIDVEVDREEEESF